MRLLAPVVTVLALVIQSSATLCLAQTPPSPQQEWATRPTIKVWPGIAPGSEADVRKESTMVAPYPPGTKLHIVRNVTAPTLTVFQPAGGNTTRTAVLICPGGGFRVLSTEAARHERLTGWMSFGGGCNPSV